MAEPSNNKFGRKLLAAFCIILAIILLVGLAALIFVNNWLNKIPRATEPATLSSEELLNIENETDPYDSNFTGPVLDPLEITWGTVPTDLVGTEENIINILLIGQDRREGEGRQRSDTMVLLTINVEKKTVTLTSFLRDLYVQIPGYQPNRLNVPYAIKGMSLLDKTLELNFGIHVDGNVEVDFSGFKKIIDLVGGVDIELNKAEVNLMTKHGKIPGLSVGLNHLDGTAALYYARIRYIDSDFQRTNRQRNVLTAIFNKCKTMSYSQIMNMVEESIGLVTTDLTNIEIMKYAVALVPMIGDMQVKTLRIPADGAYSNAIINGMYVLVPNLEANRKLLIDSLT